MNKQYSLKKKLTFILVGIIFFIFSVFLSLSVGQSKIGFSNIIKLLINSHDINPISASIILNIRMPRVIVSALIGAALSLGGLVFQALLKNPLSDPYILGISGGSALGAVIGIVSGFHRFPGIFLMGFFGSILVIIPIIWIASTNVLYMKNSLLLIGVMINSFCSAAILFITSVVPNSKLQNIVFWLMGDFSMITYDGISILIIILISCFATLLMYSYPMNLLQLGNEIAKTTGINVKRTTLTLLFFVSIMVSITVSYSGLIGFVGLVIPHVLRLFFCSDYRLLVPGCILCGAIYLIICDVIARVLLGYGELPVGVITAIIGSPIFIYLLISRK